MQSEQRLKGKIEFVDKLLGNTNFFGHGKEIIK